MIKPLPHIVTMSAYALATLDAPPGKPLISLSQNESLRPPSPLAITAATAALQDADQYPDPDWYDLRAALADHHDIPADNILCGTGSLDLIGCLTRAYAGPDRAVLAPAHSYPFFRTATQIAGARFDTAAEDGTTASVDTLLAAVRPDTTLVFLANPGNPTGTRLPRSALDHLRAGLPDDTLLIIDEAYGEFADHLNELTFDMPQTGNTIILRTFSKAYGLAGARVGWGLFPPDVAGQMRKVMNPNNVAAASQAAALMALKDQSYMVETVAQTGILRDRTTTTLTTLDFTIQPSLANFILIGFDTPEAARRTDAALQAEGIFLRAQTGADLPSHLRMTIGSEPAMTRALETLTRLKQEGTI